MKKSVSYFLITLLIIWAQPSFAETTRSISLTSYYPAPMGAYDQFRLIPYISNNAIGDGCIGNEGLIHVEEGTAGAPDGQLRMCVNDGSGSKWSFISGAWQQSGVNLRPADPNPDLHVGIGTSTPAAYLHIHDNEDGYNPLLPNSYTTASDEVPLLITAVDPTMAFIGYDQSHGQSSIHFLEVENHSLANKGDYKNMWTLGRRSSSGGTSCDGCLYVSYLGNPVVGDFWTNATGSRLHITPTGNVGIGRFGRWSGDALPHRLDKAEKDLHLAFSTGATTVRLQEISPDTAALGTAKNDDKIWDLRAIGNAGAVDRFSIYGGIHGALKEDLVIAASLGATDGYVGIGTSNPLAQLHVVPDVGEEAVILEGDTTPTIEFFDTNDSDFRLINSGDVLSFEYDNGGGWKTALYIENFIRSSNGNDDERLVFGKRYVPYEDDRNAEVIVHGDGNVLLSDISNSIVFSRKDCIDPPNPTLHNPGINAYNNTNGTKHQMIFSRVEDDGTDTHLLAFYMDDKHAGIRFQNPTHTLDVGTAPGFYCDEGQWYPTSSREHKTDIRPLGLSDALTALEGMQPVTFKYKEKPNELRAGFIAEDLPELVATEDRKTLTEVDLVATLTKVTQHLYEKVEKRNQILKEQEDLIQKMKDKLNNL